MYGKLFASMYDGSMLGAGPEVFALWPYIIANADKSGIVEINFGLVGFKLGMAPESVEKVIKRFMEPDLASRSKEQEGRKLEKVGEYSYRIINFAFYQAIKSAEQRRESNRMAQAKYRLTHGKPASFGKALEKEYSKRRKNHVRDGKIAGASLALKDGFDSAQDLQSDNHE